MRFILTFVFAAAMFVQAAFAQLETSPLSVKSGDESHAFTVELATTPEEIQQGLMFRETLAPDAGMLFDFGTTRPVSMWMKNTLIPLDMLFIFEDGRVAAIARNTQPGSLRSVSPGVPVRAVLELPGGRARELGIEPGDTVVHTLFGNTGG
ncbi:MAG: hypothetical protein CVT79_00315 [Alphaproteobacteria bacterium HGW-Alphaproteobacteria-18]|nr:MAG: hypothetical protein CVT79_00315 [Alphaproteobacteria bacterium HGW-Alphaproteobacteria-18]